MASPLLTSLPFEQDTLVYALRDIPLRIPLARKRSKVQFCTMNSLIRVFHRAFHSIKLRMYKMMARAIQAEGVPPQPLCNSYAAVFVYYAPDRRKRDLSNMCAFMDKFLLDTLVNQKVLCDDDVTIISSVHYFFGGVTPKKNTISFFLFRNPNTEP